MATREAAGTRPGAAGIGTPHAKVDAVVEPAGRSVQQGRIYATALAFTGGGGRRFSPLHAKGTVPRERLHCDVLSLGLDSVSSRGPICRVTSGTAGKSTSRDRKVWPFSACGRILGSGRLYMAANTFAEDG